MKTSEYLDAVRAKLALPSDYALQKPLALSRSQLSKYRTGHDSLSDTTALRVAEILGMEPGRVLLDMHMERSKTPEVRAAWGALMEKISTGFETLMRATTPRRRRLPA